MELMAATLANQMKPEATTQKSAMENSNVANSSEKNGQSAFANSLDSKSWEKDSGLKSKFDRKRAVGNPTRSPQERRNSAHAELDPTQRRQIQDPRQKNAKAEAVDSLTRRAALQTFIRKMNDELNVSPTEIVSAFMGLTPQQMTLPPEQNIGRIIQNLNLDQQSSEKANVYFQQMLAESSANSMADYLTGSKRQISLEVMSQFENRQNNVASSIDNMNDKFFASPKVETLSGDSRETRSGIGLGADLGGLAAGTTAAASQVSQQAGATVQSGPSTQGLQAMLAQQNMASEPASFGAQSETASEGFEMMNSMKMQSGLALESTLQAPKAAAASAGLAAYGLNSMKTGPANIGSEAIDLEPSSFQFSGSELAGLSENSGDSSSLEGFEGSAMGSDQSQSESAEALEGAEDVQFTVKTDNSTNSKSTNVNAKIGGDFSTQMQPTEAEHAKNVRDVIEQTQFLMKKGGGEAKVILNPEGMGQINLKVVTEGDQVSVDMITESAEAKKLIEKGLGDLKATLSSHKLNVENVKVDMADQISKQFDHAHDEAQRQSAQHFMESFREQNGSWRQGFFDIPGVRAPRSQGGEDGLSLEPLSNKKRSDRRLDLVA